MSEKKATTQSSEYVILSTHNGVTTIRMNNPRKLNGWTMGMMSAFKQALLDAAQDDATKAVIFTGTGDYYSAGVNLGGSLQLKHPKALHKGIIEHNQTLFEAFLDFPKPILAAVNGHAIGASVTTATLCDAIIASDNATFSTPFALLGLPPEGCSSIHFERIMSQEDAHRMLGPDGWKPTAAEALDAGLVQWTATQDNLLDEAQRIAEGWIAEGKLRSFQGGSQLAELKATNALESIGIADAFLSAPFLKQQYRFLWSKKKRGPAMMFLTLWLSRPIWSLMLR